MGWCSQKQAETASQGLQLGAFPQLGLLPELRSVSANKAGFFIGSLHFSEPPITGHYECLGLEIISLRVLLGGEKDTGIITSLRPARFTDSSYPRPSQR